MITSNFLKRSIYRQDGEFSYDFRCSLSNTSGSLEFGFMDENSDTLWGIEFFGGKIFLGDRFVGAYRANQEVLISGVVDAEKQNLYINGQIVSLGLERESGAVDFFFVSPQDVEVDFSLNVKGKSPEFSVSDVVFHENSIEGTGNISNFSSNSFRIFGGTCESGYKLSGIPTEVPYGSSEFKLVKMENPKTNEDSTSYEKDIEVSFFTNFGKITEIIKDKTTYPINQILNLSMGDSISGTGELSGVLEWENYEGDALSDRDIKIKIELQRQSGSGNFFATWGLYISDINGENEIDFLSTGRTDVVGNMYVTNADEYVTNGIGRLRIRVVRKQSNEDDVAVLRVVGRNMTISRELEGL